MGGAETRRQSNEVFLIRRPLHDLPHYPHAHEQVFHNNLRVSAPPRETMSLNTPIPEAAALEWFGRSRCLCAMKESHPFCQC